MKRITVDLFEINRFKIKTQEMIVADTGKLISLSVTINGHEIYSENEFPFVALQQLRDKLRVLDFDIKCMGARNDVHPSGMQLDTYDAYLLELGKKATETVYIFEETDRIDLITSVSDQNNFFSTWVDSVWRDV